MCIFENKITVSYVTHSLKAHFTQLLFHKVVIFSHMQALFEFMLLQLNLAYALHFE